MNRQPGFDAPIAKPAALAAGWMALLTALICALIPLGVDTARPVGSAFDPTSPTVTLSIRSNRVDVDVRQAKLVPAVKSPLPKHPVDVADTTRLVALATPSLASASFDRGTAGSVLSPVSPTAGLGPRGPPLA